MAVRNVILIDEDLCDGCGKCTTACHEGAIEIIDGKARLVSDTYCDGLGDCIGECPQGAITIEEREAADFDEEAVASRLRGLEGMREEHPRPGSVPQSIERCELVNRRGEPDGEATVPSALENWPVQLMLVPARAPYLDGADLLFAADCVPFALADFHGRFLEGKTVVVGCPKLDNAEFYRKKLAQIFIQNDIRTIEVVYMEVPCCFGLVHLVHEALKESGKNIPMDVTKVGIGGDVIEKVTAEEGA